MKQGKIFLGFEGDNWYERNKKTLEAEKDIPILLVEFYGIKPTRILEVGASNGYRLARIYEKYGCDVHAVEPSEKAIEDGIEKYPFIKFQRATADDMVYDRQFFDLIIVNSVFHWVDRETLLISIANIDNTLKWGGHIIIGDFQLHCPIKRRYHHIKDEEVFTYKLDYKKIFMATGFYKEIATLSLNHDNKTLTSNTTIDDYFSVSLLKKEDIYMDRGI